ncbi:MAG: autotransporter-associated beta strand repeat-containing protein [Planctomycetia bacterium]|nr:autotransporter-associated beta strand repeat-containing protein [Planctomycetia bacterium]
MTNKKSNHRSLSRIYHLPWMLLVIVGLLAEPMTAHAVTRTWSTTSGNWSSTFNWGFSSVPNAAGDIANIDNAISSNATITIDTTSRTIGILNIGDTDDTNSFTIAASGGASLIFDNNASHAQINQESSSNGDTISAPILLKGSFLDIANADADTFTISGGISAGSSGTKTITNLGGSTGAVLLSGSITNNLGTVAVVQNSGTSALTLSGSANTFTGGVTLTTGTLNINSTTALGATASTLTITAGTINNTSGSAKTLANNNAQTWNGDFAFTGSSDLNLGTGAVSLGSAAGTSRTVTANAGTLTIGGVISNGTTANSLIKAGAGTMTFSGTAANTFTGATTVNAGTLVLDKSDNVTAVAGSLTIGDGSGTDVVLLASNNQIASTSIVTINTGGILRTDGFEATIAGLTGTGTVTNDSATSGNDTLLTINVASGSNTFSGIIQDGSFGNVGITKSGAGTQIFSGANIYNNATSIIAGVLNIQNSSALGDPVTGGTSVTAGAALQVQGGIAVGAEVLTLNGTGVATDGALRNISGTNSWAGGVVLGSASRINSDAGTLTITGGITGTGLALSVGGAGDTTIQTNGINTSTGGTLTKDGNGTLTISATSNYTGNTTISDGVVNIQNATALGTTGSTSVASGAALQLQNSIAVSGQALTLNGTGVSADGAMRNISGTNSWAGAVTLGTASRINSDAGTLTLSGGITGTGLGLTVGGAGNTTVQTTGINTSTGGTLTKDGNGTLTLAVASNYTGTTTISAGALNVQNAAALGTTAAGTSVTSGATLQLQGGIAVTGETLTLNGTGVSTTGALRNISGDNSWSTAVNLATDSRVNSDANTLTLSGGITGTGNDLTVGGSGNTTISTTGITTGSLAQLIKDGSGVLTVAVTSTHTGATTINAGTLALGAAGNGTNTPLGTTATGTSVTATGAALDLDGITLSTSEALSIIGTGVSSNGALTNSDVAATYSGVVTIGTGGASIGGTGDITLTAGLTANSNTLTKVGTNVLTLNATSSRTGATNANAGNLVVGNAGALGSSGTITVNSGGELDVASGVTFTRGITLVSGGTFGGKGTYTPGSSFSITAGAHIAPGINDIGTFSINTTSNTTTFNTGSVLDIDINGANTDLLNVTGTLNTSSATSVLALNMVSPTLGKYKIAGFTTGITFTGNGNLASDGGFGAVTGLDSAYTLSVITGANGEIDLTHKADQTLTSPNPATINIITGATTSISAILSNTAPTNSTALAVALANNSGTGGTVSSLTSSSGSTVAGGSTSNIGGTFTAGAVGLGKTWSIKNTDLNAITTTATTGGTVNVYSHTAPTLTVASGNNQSIIINNSLTSATATLSNPGSSSTALDVGASLTNLTGATGSAVLAAGGTGTYTATGFVTNSVGIGKTLAVSLTAGDDQTVIGHNALAALNTSFTYNVYNHSAPTFNIAGGNNQSVIINNSLAAATVTLANTAGATPAPLDVNSLSNLTGASTVGSGASGTYTATGFVTNSVGIGKTLNVGLNAGDQQTITGANALSPFSSSFTYSVYNHSAPTLTFASGNNQSGFVGGSFANATFTLSNTVGTTPAPLDVNTLSNLTGTSGSGVVASGGTGTYTSSALDNSTAGIGKTLAVSLKAGDQQTVVGANALSTLSQTVTYNVYTHSAPTLTVATGNNQSVIVNTALSSATASLSNPGSTSAPLDVNSLSNLTGTTGSGVVAAAGTGTYTATGFVNSSVGIGKTLVVGLNAGDQQTITGANALTPLSTTFTYNVYNHSAPTLTIAGGNNQAVIINNSLAAATTTLANTAGTTPAPLDVNTFSNLSGASSVGSGASGTYTASGFVTNSVGINKTLAVSLKAGDQQTISGASALSTLNQTFTYSVYNHSAPTLTIAGGNNQSIITGGTLAAATTTLANTAGTTPAPLDVNTLSNLTGTTGSGVVASGASGTYTATGFDTTTVGLNKTLATSLLAGDQQTIVGASALSSKTANFTYNVYAHSNGVLTLNTNDNQTVIVGATAATAGLSLTNAGANNAALDVNSLTSNLTGSTGAALVAANGSQSYTGTFNTSTAGLGQTQTFTATVQDTNLSGRGSAYAASATGTINVYGHSAPTLTVASGNNQSVIINGSLAAVSVALADTAGSTPAPLDVNSLINLTGSTGSGVVASGGTGSYTATGFITNTVGLNKTLSVSLNAGDQQTITGHNGLSNLSTNVTYSVYNHSTPTLSIASGNNQSGFVGGSFANATLTLANTTGAAPAPLDVNTLSNLTGTTGSGVVASGGSGTYTSTALDSSTSGIGKTLAVSLKAGDQQTLSGANALTTLSQTVTYNVYDHAAPTLTIASGNNQSVIVGNSLSAATLSLSNPGTASAPLDVANLNHLTGTTGSNVVTTGNSASYTATGFNTAVAGIGKTLAVGLDAGDPQSLAGHNALSTLNQTLTYNVYDHASGSVVTDTLTIPDVIVGYSSPVASSNALTVNNAAGARVNLKTTNNGPNGTISLNNVSNVAAGSSGLLTATMATGKGVSNFLSAITLTYADDSALAGAQSSGLGTSSIFITGNVYDHARGFVSGSTLVIPDVFVDYASPVASTGSISVNNLTGFRVNLKTTNNGPVNSISLGNVSNIVANASAPITASLATGKSSGSFSQGVTLTYADDSSLVGASNNVGTDTITVTGNIYEHASGSTVGGSTLNFTDVIVGYGSTQSSANAVTINNAAGFRVNLKTTNNGPQNGFSMTNISSLAANSNGTITGTMAAGKAVGSYSQNLALTYADNSAIAGASNNTGTQNITLNSNVYDHSSGSVDTASLVMQDVIVGYSAPVTSNTAINVSNAAGFRVNLKTTNTGPLSGVSLSNVAGVAAGGSGALTAGLATGKGVGSYSQNISLVYADDSALAGASSITGSQTVNVSGNVLNHSNGSFNSTSVNNDSLTLDLGTVITGASTQTAGFNIANLSGANTAGLNRGTITPSGVNTSELTTDLGVNNFTNLAAGSSQAFTASMSTGTVGTLSATYTVGIGDRTDLAGATLNATPLTLNLTGDVKGHAAPTATITAGDGFSAIVGATGLSATVNLANGSGHLAGLQVSAAPSIASGSISNPGALLLAPGASQNYNATFNAGAVGAYSNQVTFTAGDDQLLTGHNALGSVTANITGTVYDHASGSVDDTTLTIADTFVGYASPLASTNSISVSNASGFRVNLKTTNDGPQNSISLGNVSGITAGNSGSISASLATGKGAGSYSQGLTLTYADDSALAGASSNVGTQAVTVTGNVYDHASGSAVGGTTLNFADVIVGYGSAQTSTNSVTVNNAAGFRVNLKTTNDGPLGGLSVNNVSGVAANGNGTVTGSLATGKGVGNYSQGITLTYADDSAIAGASSNLGTQAVTLTGNVYDHAAGSVDASTLSFANVIVGYSAPVTSSNSISVSNATGFRANLKTTNDGPVNSVSLGNASGVAAGGSSLISASLATGKAAGSFSENLTLTYADDSALAGASSNVGTQSVIASGNVLNHAVGSATVTAGNNFTAIVGTTGLSATIGVTNTAGSPASALQVQATPGIGTGSLSDPGQVFIGGIDGGAASQSYTATFNVGNTAGSFSNTVTFSAGDRQSLAGASGLASLTTTIQGTLLDHAGPSLSQTTVNFGNVLAGASVSAVNVNLQNVGANRANLVLTGVNGSGDTATLTRAGNSTGTIAANGSLSNSIGLVTSAAGNYSANYGYDVEDQNLAGGTDLATQNLAVSANVYAAAQLSANTNITLDSGSLVSIQNASATPLRASAYVDSITLSPHWTLHNSLQVGSSIAAGAGTSPLAKVNFSDAGLLNGQSLVGELTIALENDQALAGATNQDLGPLTWNLGHTVTNGVGNGTADVTDGGSYAGLNGKSDKALASVAKLVDGTNTSGDDTIVEMTWRNRTTPEANGFAASGDSAQLVSDVVKLTGTDSTVFVFEMTVGPLANNATDIYLAWLDGGIWKLANEGNHGVNTTDTALLDYQGSYQASNASLLTLGAYGYDAVAHKVWAVLDHNSDFSSLEIIPLLEGTSIPEPSTWALGLIGLIGLAWFGLRRRQVRQS